MIALAVLALPWVPLALTAAVGWHRWVSWVHVAAATALIAAATTQAIFVLDAGPVEVAGGLVRVDALSAFWVLVIAVIALLATWFSTAYIQTELDEGHTDPPGARLYGVLVAAFIDAMLVAVSTDNLGVMWVAIEATTVATAFLVGHRRSRQSLEASWKYVIIGSVGVAVALLGTVLVYYAARHSTVADTALSWTALTSDGATLQPATLRLAIGLLVVGFGTKVGLAPMHAWLPDAHSQAPAPVSALMSGVLLSVAFYALLRYKVIADASLGTGYMRSLLVAGGLLSVAVAASLLIGQRDYKRLLAYSSIEHMGVLALGAAAGGPLAMTAVLLHVAGHGLGKSALFLSSGELLHTEGTTSIATTTGLLQRRPRAATLFALGLFAVVGLPPFSLFASEIGIIRGGFDAGLGWVMAIALALLLVVSAAIARHGQHLLLGGGDNPATRGDVPVNPGPAQPARPLATWVPLAAGLGLCALLGVTTWPIDRLLAAAAAVAGG